MRLHEAHRDGELSAQQHQRVFVVVAEILVVQALHQQRAQYPSARAQRHRELAARLLESRQWNLGHRHDIDSGFAGALAHRTRISGHVHHVADADGHAFTHRGADQAFAQRDLGAGAVELVAAAGEQREHLLRGIEQPQHRVIDAQLGRQAA